MRETSLHPVTGSSCRYRHTEDDFFCLRYQVWYPSLDCAIRTFYRTSPGCLRCEQGRFNLKRHASELRSIRFPADLVT